MKSNLLTPAMEKLRPDLGEVVALIEAQAPYGSVSLSTREMTRFMVDNNQERVVVGEPTAGVILRAYGGKTMRERALGGFKKGIVLFILFIYIEKYRAYSILTFIW